MSGDLVAEISGNFPAVQAEEEEEEDDAEQEPETAETASETAPQGPQGLKDLVGGNCSFMDPNLMNIS